MYCLGFCLERLRKICATAASVLTRFRTERIPNTNVQRHYYNNLVLEDNIKMDSNEVFVRIRSSLSLLRISFDGVRREVAQLSVCSCPVSESPCHTASVQWPSKFRNEVAASLLLSERSR
jgi:hypothetical protein